MSFSVGFGTLILIIFLVWLVLSLVRGEARATQFWFHLLVSLAILATFGIHSLNP